MQIYIKNGKFRLRLRLPLSVIKTPMGRKMLLQSMSGGGHDQPCAPTPATPDGTVEANRSDTALTRQQAKQAYKILKAYVKANGHFTMLDIRACDDEDGQTTVKISV